MLTNKKKSRKALTLRDLHSLRGETGIRTPGASQHNGFQDRRNRPLCHLSKTLFESALFLKGDAKVRIILESANFREYFFDISFQSIFKTRQSPFLVTATKAGFIVIP